MFSKIRTYFKSLTTKQLILRLCLLIIPFAMYTGFLIYIFTIPGDKGLISWTDWVRQYVVYLILFDILLFVLILVDFFVASVRKVEIRRLPSRAVLIFLTLGLIISLGGFGFLGTVPLRRAGDKAPQLLVLGGVGVNNVPNMAVCFYTQEKTTNILHIGKTIGLELPDMVEPKASKTHGFLLNTLDSNTTYYYRINEGILYNFTTPADTPNYARFAISSDLHFGADNANRTATQRIVENIISQKYDILFFLGDMVEYGLFDAQYKEAMDFMSPYVTTIPYRPAIGNHDTFFGGKTLWRDYFSPELILGNPRDYFHINLNGIHIFVLDLEWGTETYTRAQKNWFEGELAELSEDDWILVMNHAMYYSSGYFTSGDPWWDNQAMIDEFEDLFLEYDVDLVFSGHNHHMETLNNSGIVYNIIGAFGGYPDPDFHTQPIGQEGTGSLWYLNNQHGHLEVEIINETDATLTFRSPEYIILQSFPVLE